MAILFTSPTETNVTPSQRTERLEMLARQRIKAKRDEDIAAEIRRGIDKDIAAELKSELAAGKEYGTASVKLEDAGVKLVVSFGYTRSFSPQYETDIDTMPKALRDLAKWDPSVKASAWDALSDADKLLASKYVTTKPSSPSVKIEVI